MSTGWVCLDGGYVQRGGVVMWGMGMSMGGYVQGGTHSQDMGPGRGMGTPY